MLPVGKLLLLAGVLLIALGLLVTFAGKGPFFGRLPGDIRIEKENFTFYFPLATCLVVSLLVSLILWFLRR